MITVIITAWNEPITIGKAIKCVTDSKYSGIPADFEVIQVSPDDTTLIAGRKAAEELNLGNKFIQIKDPRKGKPYALGIAFKRARGDILVLTDGEVYLGKGSVKSLIRPLLSDKKIGGATGRPISLNPRTNMMGYFSHLLADSGHHRRIATSTNVGEYSIHDKKFFPMNGYSIAMRNVVTLPDKALDDAYLSYELRNQGYLTAYVPNALVYVKFPTTLRDYFLQKTRNLGGHAQIKRLGVMRKEKETRSFGIELTYAFFAITYPKNLKEFIWSLALFPIRLWTWILVFYQQYILKKEIPKDGWKRIESTK